EEDGGRSRAGDEADEEVARDVAADRPVDVRAGAAPVRLDVRWQRTVGTLDDLAALQEHEQREEGDRDDADDRGDDALRGSDRGPRDPEDAPGALLLDRLADPVDDVVVGLQEAERAA